MRGTDPWGISAPRNRRAVVICALAAAAALALASCSTGGISTSTFSTGGGTAGSAVSQSTLASLQKTITQAEAVPQFSQPGPPVSASVLQGKSVLVMPSSSQIDACTAQTNDFQQLGKQLGLNVTVFPDQGIPTQWAAGVEQAESDHAAAIAMLCGIPPQPIAAQLANANGMAVIDGNYNNTTDFTGINAETAINTVQGITEDVDYAVLQQNGKPVHALVVSTQSITQGPAASAAAQQELNRICKAKCSDVNLYIPIANWALPGPTGAAAEVKAQLTAHKNINAVIVVFDGIVQFAYNSVAAFHRSGLEIYTWGGSRTVEAYMLEHGSIVAADPGPDEQWDAYEAMDQLIRLLSGKPAAPITSEVVPDRFWVTSNVSMFFGPGGQYGNAGYGGNKFVNGFDSLWGVPGAAASPSASG